MSTFFVPRTLRSMGDGLGSPLGPHILTQTSWSHGPPQEQELGLVSQQQTQQR